MKRKNEQYKKKKYRIRYRKKKKGRSGSNRKILIHSNVSDQMILIHSNVSKFFKKQNSNTLGVVWMRTVTLWMRRYFSS